MIILVNKVITKLVMIAYMKLVIAKFMIVLDSIKLLVNRNIYQNVTLFNIF